MKQIVTFGVGGYNPNKPHDNIVEVVDLPDPLQEPLDAVGALATLLVVTGALTAEDAANAVGVTPADLEAEAQAWAAAQKSVTNPATSETTTDPIVSDEWVNDDLESDTVDSD